MPPVGRGHLLTGDQIRYCLAQAIRTEAIRGVVDRFSPEQVDHFNELIADFNRRCASYRFEVSAMERARLDVEDIRSQLERDARDTYLERFKRSGQAAHAPAPETIAQQQPEQETKRISPPEAAPSATGPEQSATPAESAMGTQASAPEPASPKEAQPALASATEPPSQSAQEAAPSTGTPATAPAAAQPTPSQLPEQTPPSTPPASEIPARPAPETAKSTLAAAPMAQPPAEHPVALPSPTAAVPHAAAGTSATPAPPPATSQPLVRSAAPTDKRSDAALARYTREIQRAGSRVLDERQYPKTARAQRLQGTTQIEVRFAVGGYIRSILLGESCGNSLLDEKALEIGRSIKFPHVPKELYAREFSVRFPITFQVRKH